MAARLLDCVREEIRARHYSRRTEEAYVHWIRQYIRFHGLRHPHELGSSEITAFLTPFLRNASSRSGLRHPDRAGAPRPRRRQHDDGLHARPEPRRSWRAKSHGSSLTIGVMRQALRSDPRHAAVRIRFNLLILSGFSVRETASCRGIGCRRPAAIAVSVSLMPARRTAHAGANISAINELARCLWCVITPV
jgi:integrase-like protein